MQQIINYEDNLQHFTITLIKINALLLSLNSKPHNIQKMQYE